MTRLLHFVDFLVAACPSCLSSNRPITSFGLQTVRKERGEAVEYFFFVPLRVYCIFVCVWVAVRLSGDSVLKMLRTDQLIL